MNYYLVFLSEVRRICYLFLQSWDHILDLCLSQLQRVQEHGDAFFVRTTFFEEQLTAFEIWLDHTACLPTQQRSVPEQLPIVLQVISTTDTFL